MIDTNEYVTKEELKGVASELLEIFRTAAELTTEALVGIAKDLDQDATKTNLFRTWVIMFLSKWSGVSIDDMMEDWGQFFLDNKDRPIEEINNILKNIVEGENA